MLIKVLPQPQCTTKLSPLFKLLLGQSRSHYFWVDRQLCLWSGHFCLSFVLLNHWQYHAINRMGVRQVPLLETKRILSTLVSMPSSSDGSGFLGKPLRSPVTQRALVISTTGWILIPCLCSSSKVFASSFVIFCSSLLGKHVRHKLLFYATLLFVLRQIVCHG